MAFYLYTIIWTLSEKEWDDFAEEYYEIQQESQTTIAEDVREYLKSEKVLPAEIVADVAGGSGRFLSLAKEVNHYDLIDFSSGMLANAKKKQKKLTYQMFPLSNDH